MKKNDLRMKEPAEINIKQLITDIKRNSHPALAIGLDLSASENRPTGFCVLHDKFAKVDTLKTDDEIITKTVNKKPEVISIDSPLTLPKGRCCIKDSCKCRKFGINREAEKLLRKRGINTFPCLIKSMQKLTARGIKLSAYFREKGYPVIESYPGVAQDILGFPRKRENLIKLEKNLRDLGIEIISNKNKLTHDELDALTAALVGYFYIAGKYEALGNSDEGYLIIPKIEE